MPNILASLAKWTRSALSLASPMPSRLPEPATASRPCLSGGINPSSPPSQELPTMDAITLFVAQNPGTSRGKIAAYLGIDLLVATRELRKLVRGGTLTMSGSRRGAKYSLARSQEGAGDAQSGDDVPPYQPAA